MKTQMAVEIDLNPLLTSSVHVGECNATPLALVYVPLSLCWKFLHFYSQGI